MPSQLKRDSIGHHTEGLVKGVDGTLKVCLQERASEARGANWLPAPADNVCLIVRLAKVSVGGWTPAPSQTAQWGMDVPVTFRGAEERANSVGYPLLRPSGEHDIITLSLVLPGPDWRRTRDPFWIVRRS